MLKYTLLRIESSEIGLWSDVELALGILGMGTRKEVFQLVGGRPHAMEQLKIFVSDGAIALAVDFNIRAEIPSGPFALVISRDLSSSQISSLVHMIYTISASMITCRRCGRNRWTRGIKADGKGRIECITETSAERTWISWPS